MKMLMGLSILISGCGSAPSQPSLDDQLVARARQVVESCARSESCAQRTDGRATGYAACTGTRLEVVRVDRLSEQRVSAAFTCDVGEGYIFRVSVNGIDGPAYEEVRQCESRCPAIDEAFVPDA